MHYRFILIVLAAGTGVAAVMFFRRRRRKERDQWLSSLVHRRKKELYRYSLYDHVWSNLSDLYNPSFVSIITVLTLAFVSGIFAWWRQLPLSQEEMQLIIRLQALEVGIALIFVPITVFVIGLSSRRTEGGVTAAEVLLKQTYLFPIAILVLGLLANFAFLRKPNYGRCLILFTLSLAFFCVFRLCRVLLDEHYLHASSIGLLQDKIRRTIDLAVTQRVGGNIMLSWMEHRELEYRPFVSSWRQEENVRINHDRPGDNVQDIHLGRLAEFIEQLERSANKNGFAFEAVEAPNSVSASIGGAVNEARVRSLIAIKHRYVAKLLGDRVDEDSSTLAFYDRRLEPDSINQRRLEKLLRHAFRLASADSYEKCVERYLTNVKDETILAIRDRRTSYLENLLGVYEQLAETFLQEMKKVVGGYSLEAARQERQHFMGGWNELRWISNQLREIQQRGVLSEDPDVARLVARAPIRIAYKAIRYRDHLLFEEFTQFPQFLYFTIDKIDNLDLKKDMAGRTRVHLRELAEYGLGWELDRDGQEPEQLRSLVSMATILFVRYHELLLASLNKGRLDDFDELLIATSQILERRGRLGIDEHFNLRSEEPRITRIREARLGAWKQIIEERTRLLFSLNSCLLPKSVQPSNDELIARLNHIDGFLGMSLADLTSLYLKMPGPFTDAELDRILQAEAPYGKINRYYCYLLLKLSQQVGEQQFATLMISSDSEFIGRIKGGGPIRAILSDFETNRELWRPVVPDDWLQRVPLLNDTFDRLVWIKQLEDENRLIDTPIDRQYLAEFRCRFRTTLEGAADVRRLFLHFRAYSDVSGVNFLAKGDPKWGINTLDLKEAYVTGGRGSYANWPEEYAKDLATSEGEFAFHQLLSQLPELQVTESDLLQSLKTIVAELERSKLIPQCLIVGFQSGFHLKAEQLGALMPQWRPELETSEYKRLSGFRGMLNFAHLKIPVFSVWTRDDGYWACAVTFAGGIRWEQQSPVDDDSELETKDGFLSIEIQDLSADQDLRQKILISDPPWLHDQADKERYLHRHVLLRAVERFKINVGPDAGMKFKVARHTGSPLTQLLG